MGFNQRNEIFRGGLKKNRAQIILEFSFVMIIVFLLLYGTVRIFYWSGNDFGARRIAHEEKLTEAIGSENYGVCAVETACKRCARWNKDGLCKEYEWYTCCYSATSSSILEGPSGQLSPDFYYPENWDVVYHGFDWQRFK